MEKNQHTKYKRIMKNATAFTLIGYCFAILSMAFLIFVPFLRSGMGKSLVRYSILDLIKEAINNLTGKIDTMHEYFGIIFFQLLALLFLALATICIVVHTIILIVKLFKFDGYVESTCNKIEKIATNKKTYKPKFISPFSIYLTAIIYQILYVLVFHIYTKVTLYKTSNYGILTKIDALSGKVALPIITIVAACTMLIIAAILKRKMQKKIISE